MAKKHANNITVKKLAALFVLVLFVSGGLRFILPRIFEALAVAPPNVISYQGRILNANGVPDSSASISMEFRLFTAVAGGTCVWSNSSADCDTDTPASTVARSVALTDGLFSENLGDTSLGAPYAAIADSVFADNASLYLEVEIAGETLSPRKRIVSAGFAMNAGTLDGVDSAGFLASTGDTATGDFDFTAADILGASAFVFEGATNDGTNKTTFTVADPSAPRTITFKDESGTVAFLSDVGAAANLDNAYDNFGAVPSIINIDAAEGQTGGLEFSLDGGDDFIVDMQSTGQFLIQDTGTTFFTFGEDRTIGYLTNVTSGIGIDAGANDLTSGSIATFSSSAAFTDGFFQLTSSGLSTGQLLDLTVLNAGSTADLLSLFNNGTGDGIFVDQNGDGTAVNIESAATTANVMALNGSALTSGTLLALVGGDFTDDTGLAFSIDVTESTATADIVSIQTDFGGVNNTVLRIEADGETFSDVGFTAGAFSTSYHDALVTSTTGTFNFLNSTDGNDTLNIGGVGVDLGYTVNVATDNTTADFVVIGNDNVGTEVVLVGGDSWSINAGVGSFTSLSSAVGAGWTIASDGDGTFVDVNATGRIDAAAHANNVGLNLPTNAGVPVGVTGTVEGDVVWNATDDALYVYDGAAFTLIGGGGGLDSLDDAYDNFGAAASIINIDAAEGQTGGLEWSVDGAGDFTVDLQSTGDFVIQDAGADVFTLTDSQTVDFTSSANTTLFGLTASAMSSGTAFSVTGNSLTSGRLGFLSSSSAHSGELLLLQSTGASTGRGLEVLFNNASSTADLVYLTNAGTGSSIFVDPNGSTSSTISDASGGAIHVANTSNNDGALTLYSNNGVGQASQLATFYVDNAAFDQEVLYIVNQGVAPSVLVDQLGDSTALHVNANTTTQDVFVISATGLTSGNAIRVGSNTVTSGSIIEALADSVTFTGNAVDVSVNNAGSSGNGIFVDNNGTGSGLFLVQDGNTGTTVSTAAGGALHIDNTNNEHYGLTVYSNTAANTSPLVYFFEDSASFSSDVFHLRNDSISGTSASLYIDHKFTSGGGAGDAAVVIDTNNDGYAIDLFNDTGDSTGFGIGIQGCEDANPTSGCNFITFLDGDGTVIGAVEGDGAGGVTNASTGSDYAELFPGTYATFAQGDVLALDAAGNIKLATSANDMIGALSVNPNTLGNWVEDWQTLGTHVPVALLGQVPVSVNMQGGAIAVGDYLTLSSTPGVAMKQNGAGYSLGVALEDHVSGTGEIKVFIQPIWHAGGAIVFNDAEHAFADNFLFAESGSADSSVQGKASRALTFRGSGWNGSAAEQVGMTLLADVSNSADYQLSVQNDAGTEVAFINAGGDFALAGRLFPSNQGTLQTEKYIYYDATGSPALDYMRTNAAGWGVGSYDFAEMFPAVGEAKPGDVVVFAEQSESIMRSGATEYDTRVAGIVSTRPGFLAGEFIEGHVPVALAGRVPTNVTNENGAIAPGDPLTTSSTSGAAMKATKPGPIVGYAMEAFDDANGSIIVYVNVSYYGGGKTHDAPAANNVASGATNVTQLNMSGAIHMNGGSILSAARIIGLGERWRIEENGDLVTKGRITHVIESYQGEDVETYAVTSRQTTIQLSGSIALEGGSAHVAFEDVDPAFNDIISTAVPYRVFLTPNGAANGLYVIEKDNAGFTIRENGGASSVTVDWLVIADHKDFEPNVREPEVPEEIPLEDQQEAVVEDTPEEELVVIE